MFLNLVPYLCIFTALPGPPGVLYENAYFSLYPINRNICPAVDSKQDIIFELYTSTNPIVPQILLFQNDKSIQNSNLNFGRPTVFYFHGFLEGGAHGSAKTVQQAYMRKGGHNFILVNAQRLIAGPWYITAAQNTEVIGKYTAVFIDYLVSKGLKLKKVHLIGHSLGGQSAGVCGHYIQKGKVSRITGLDPAAPLFLNVPNILRLDQNDADFVDVIHTDSEHFGFGDTMGHADFYPNGGVATQPGCSSMDIFIRNPTSFLELIFCSHWRSWIFYTESINSPKSFPSVKADSWTDYQLGNYDSKRKEFMGYGASIKARGTFYLTTNSKSPYSKPLNIK